MVETFLVPEFRGTTSCVARHVCGLDDQVGADNLGISSDSGWSRATFTTAAARPDRRFYRASHLAPRTSHIAQYPSTPHCSKVCETGGCGQYPFRHFAVSFVKTILT